MTEEEKVMLNKMIEGVHKQFIVDIERTRIDKIKGDIKEIAQGQIYSGEQAHKLGLVDELKSLWQAGRQIHEQLSLPGEFGPIYIKKKKKKGLFAILDNFEEVSTHIKEISTHYKNLNKPLTLMFQ